MTKFISVLAALAGAILPLAAPVVQAQQVSVSRAPPKQISITEFAQDLKRHLESKGYTNVALTPGDKGISGTALKGGRKAEIIFDEKGQLRVSDPMAASSGSQSKLP